MEIALSTHCGPQDIVTPIRPEDELIRHKAGGAPRNFSTSPALEEKFRAAIAGGDVARIRQAREALEPTMRFWNHMPAKTIKARLDPAFWSGAYKFTIDRHPYEYLVSSVYWVARHHGGGAAAWWRRQAILLNHIVLKPRNFALYSIGGEVCVDRVLRHESLAQDLREIAPKIGFDAAAALPQAKSGYRPARPTSDLGAFHRWLVRMRWRREFTEYHYQP